MIKLSKSCLDIKEQEAVQKVLENGYLGMGPEVKKFETILSNYFGREAICVSNGTSALQLSLQAIGIRDGDEVLVQSLTYVASFQAISASGAIPIACDVDPSTLTIDLDDAQQKVTARTKGIMPVHYAGDPGNLDAIYSFAKKNKIRVIEDAAHAFNSNFKGQKIGSFGDIVCFSFDGIKNITSGEGGCVVTSDETVKEAIKNARLLGVENDTVKRFEGKRSWDFDVKHQGWRYHMSDVMAAIGVVQFKKLRLFSQRRRELARLYDAQIGFKSEIKFYSRNYNCIVPHIYAVQLPSTSNRDALRTSLLNKGIETGLHYKPNHLHSFYCGDQKQELVATDKIYSRLVTLPLHPDLSNENIRYIVEELKVNV